MTNNWDFMAEVSTSLRSAATKASEALAFGRAGDNAKAMAKWRVVFGDYFPAYG
jgi:hypothetical protein